MRNDLSFRKFFELQQVRPNYFDKLKDELGVKPEDIDKAPHWLANATLGKYTYNGLTYRFRWVKNGQDEITGAMVQPDQTQRAYQKDNSGNMVRNPDSNPDQGKEFFVSKSELAKMMNQEVPPGGAQQMGQGGMGGAPGGGMPPMGGGMGV
jgi:hypothetical protein